jgi:hypothetical protein
MMKTSEQEELWFRQLAEADGEALSEGEQESLKGALKSDQRILEDCQLDNDVDGLLRGHFGVNGGDEAFVSRVMGSIASEELALSPAPGDALASSSRSFFWPLVFGAVTAAAASFAFIALLPIQPSQAIQPSQQELANKLGPSAKVSFAHLVPSSDCIWEQGSPPERLGEGMLNLSEGFAHIRFDKGPSIKIEGPAQFEMISPLQAVLHRGRLKADIPAHSEFFAIATPISQVIDRNTAFDLAVAADGTTDIAVTRGQVSLKALRDSTRTWTLGKIFQEMTFYAGPGALPVGSGTVIMRKTRGPFRALISLGGESFPFDNIDDFKRARNHFIGGFQNFSKRFREFRKSIEEEKNAFKGGTAEINGQKFVLDKLEDLALFRRAFVDRLRTNLQRHVKKIRQGRSAKNSKNTIIQRQSKSGSEADSFKGVIEINGRRWVFDNKKDYEEAQQKLLKNKQPH